VEIGGDGRVCQKRPFVGSVLMLQLDLVTGSTPCKMTNTRGRVLPTWEARSQWDRPGEGQPRAVALWQIASMLTRVYVEPSRAAKAGIASLTSELPRRNQFQIRRSRIPVGMQTSSVHCPNEWFNHVCQMTIQLCHLPRLRPALSYSHTSTDGKSRIHPNPNPPGSGCGRNAAKPCRGQAPCVCWN
jgi:hypothetical protein